jgi:hypothetical protein
MSGLVLDLDRATPNWAALERAHNMVIVFSTWSHSVTEAHFRIVVPFADLIAVEY